MGLKVKGGMWCGSCEKSVAGQKSTRKAAGLGKLLISGGYLVDAPGPYHCPVCGQPVRPATAAPGEGQPLDSRTGGTACRVAGCGCGRYAFERRQDNADGTFSNLCDCGHAGLEHTGKPRTRKEQKAPTPKASKIIVGGAVAFFCVAAVLKLTLGWNTPASRIPAGAPNVLGLNLDQAKTRLQAANVTYAYDASQGLFSVLVGTNWIVCGEHAPDSSDSGHRIGGDALDALSADVWLDLGHYGC